MWNVGGDDSEWDSLELASGESHRPAGNISLRRLSIKLAATKNTAVIHRVGQNKRGHRLMTTILSNLNRFKKESSPEDSLVNL